MELEKKKEYCTFTSATVTLFVNDQVLGGVNDLVVEDFKGPTGKITRITLNTFAGFSQDVIELMRNKRFSFRLMNSTTSSGWISLDAELESFKMTLTVEDVLHQRLVIATPTFVYGTDIRAEALATKEKEDLENLINIIKENQTKVGKAVLPEVKEEKSKKNKSKRA